MGTLSQEFDAYRGKMNEQILKSGNRVMKRLFSLDTLTYQAGALDVKTKEMMGLVASLVLRCDDCVKYHVQQCHSLGMNHDEFFELLAVANMVGGSIVIPHTRRALEFWNDLGGQ